MSRLSLWLLIVGSLAMFLFFASCGQNSGNMLGSQTNYSGTPGKGQRLPTTLVSPPVGSSCGEVNMFGTVVANPPQAETCFLTAFLQCQPRTLTFTSGVGLESINTHVFSLVKNGGVCTIADRFTNTTQNVAPPLGGTHTATYTCSSLTQQNGGLLFSNCGAEGNVAVPPPRSNTP